MQELIDLYIGAARRQLEPLLGRPLDDGELHLLAWLSANGLLPKVMVLLSTADKAAIVATGRLNGLDALVSLEHLAQNSGATRGQLADLKNHYRTGWLDEIKFMVRFDMLL